MANIPSQPGRRASSLPEVSRPSSTIWQPLEAESIRWEGQVLIVGGDQDMPALLVITRARIVLISQGQIALEAPRDWLHPAPQLAAENGVRLFISPDREDTPPEPMLLRARAGRGAAAELVAVLTGRPLPLQPDSSSMHIPSWKEKIGASAPVALPALDDDDRTHSVAAVRPTWPPVEQDGLLARPKPRPEAHGRPMQSVVDQRRANMPVPTPVPAAVSRAARKQGTRADGFTIAEDGSHAAVAPVAQQRSRSHHIVAWTLRAAILVMLLGTIGYFGRDRIQTSLGDIRDRIPADVQTSLGIADDENPNEVAITTDTGENDAPDDTGDTNPPVAEPTAKPVETEVAQVEPSEVPVEQTDPTANMGGPTGELPPTNGAETVTEDPTEPVAVVEPTEVPVEPTEVPVDPTKVPVEPTEVPVEPTAVPTEEPTIAPTAEPTLEPTEIPTEVPTFEPTTEPTDVPTEEPTEIPTEEATAEPTAESTPEPTENPTESKPETPTEEPTLVPQEPSVLPETTPEQAVVADGFRYTVEGASVGETVPELPEVNSVGGYGEWVVLSMSGQNMSSDAQVFDMGSFRLYADGQEILVDVGNAWVSSLLGNSPAFGNTDAIQWASGESHRFTLTFLVPPGAQSLVLQAGGQSFDLGRALENPEPLLSEQEQAPVESDLIQATVVDVLDAETIVVEIDGVQQTVRYLSVNAPTGDACYAAEATDANQALVAGQTVTLERQATNVDARGNWVRDVWITNDAGQPVLVSQQLVLAGAAETDISDPNTRFAGWLQDSQTSAQEEGAGIWSSCGE